jgi:hypothetical protein
MKLQLTSVFIIFLLCFSPLIVAQSDQNSPQTDILDNQIKKAFAKKDYQRIAELINQRHALGGHFPPPLWYIQADAYYQLGQKSAALQALNSYLPQANHGEYPYNEAVDLAARIRDEMDTTNRRESTISWAASAQGSRQSVRHGHIDIDGKTANLIGVSLECTYVGVSDGPGAVPGMRSGWTYYVRMYEDNPTDSRNFPVSSFPNDVPVTAIISKHSLRLTMHLLAADSAKRFPDNVRPPWDGWYDWSEKRWHVFMERGENGVVLWDRKRGTGPFGSASRFNELLSATYGQDHHWNRGYQLVYLDSYRISFPSMETTQTISLGEDLSHKGPGDPDFCQVVGSACQTLRTNVLSRFARLQPTECTPKAYLEPDNFAQAVAAAKPK